ncbi:MAG: hypothetical protein ABIJ09_16375 [Pseudomonadota bacterium]
MQSSDAAAGDDGGLRDVGSQDGAGVLDGSQGPDAAMADTARAPQVEIRAPNNGSNLTTHQAVVTVSGTCSTDVVALSVGLGVLEDADCSDGTWSLQPYAMDYPPRPHDFAITATNAAGAQASDSQRITYAYVRLEGGSAHVHHRQNPARVSGSCADLVVGVDFSDGTVVDADCSDGAIEVELDFPSGEGSYPLVASARDAQGREESVTLQVHYDITAPDAVTLVETFPPSPSQDNFPRVRGDAEAEASVQLFADAVCSVALTGTTASWDHSFWTTGLRIAVLDASTTHIHARARDLAGNLSPCSTAVFEYTDASPGSLPPCDLLVGADMTFASLQQILDDTELHRDLYLADGVVTLCLGSGVVVSTTGRAEGERLEIPGDDFRLLAPAGRATLHNLRDDAFPSSEEARGVLNVQGRLNFAMAGLDLVSDGDGGVALRIEDSSVAFLRNLGLRGSDQGGTALRLPVETSTVWLAELSGSTLQGSTAFHTRNLSLRRIAQTGFRFHGGIGIDLQNSSILVSEILDSVVSSDHPTQGGTGIRLWSANRSVSIQRLSGCTVRRGPDATVTDGRALAFSNYPGDATYVRTQNVVDNTFCWAGTGEWAVLLDTAGLPTTPYDSQRNSETNGAASFPWGDASDGADNPGSNVQALWGGPCP